jgi:hypothetical protein
MREGIARVEDVEREVGRGVSRLESLADHRELDVGFVCFADAFGSAGFPSRVIERTLDAGTRPRTGRSRIGLTIIEWRSTAAHDKSTANPPVAGRG